MDVKRTLFAQSYLGIFLLILVWGVILILIRTLNQARHQAEAANRAKSVFLANISHELRTPLNAILGFSELMHGDPDLSPKHKEELGIINRSGGYLLELINDVLELAKVEAGQVSYAESSFDLYDTLENILKMIRHRAEEQDLQLIFERGDDVPRYIKTDERKLRQILLNLLGNAVKFTEKGGVVLRVKRQDKEGTSQADSSCLYFEVEDSGPGLEPEEKAVMFEAFTQTRSGYEKKEGTGLGLAIAHQFVHHLGGEMNVTGGVGRGTIFSFSVCVKTAKASDIKRHPQVRKVIGLKSNENRQNHPYRILVVDDHKENRTLLRCLLEKAGFLVKTAENGQQAVHLNDRWKPDLIWMDMRMPVMDGYEATKSIQTSMENKSDSRPVIIALTASAFKEDRDAVLAAGCDDFVCRPCNEEEIFSKMHEHLGIDFIYEPSADTTFLSPKPARLAVEAFQAEIGRLPSEIIKQLKSALELSDMEQMDQIIEAIRLDHQALPVELKKRLDTFQYDRMLSFLRGIEASPVKAAPDERIY